MPGRSLRWVLAALALGAAVILVDTWMAPAAPQADVVRGEQAAPSPARAPVLPSGAASQPELLAGALDAPTATEDTDALSSAEQAPVVLRGRVGDPDGAPIAGASLELRQRERAHERALLEVGQPMVPATRATGGQLVSADEARSTQAPPLAASTALGSATSDAEGRFVLTAAHLPEGARIEAQAAGHAHEWFPVPADPEDELDLVLRWVATVHGRVLDALTGNPLAGASVRAGGEEVLAGADGGYRLEHVLVGDTSFLRTQLAGYVPEETPLLVRERRAVELDILLRRGRPLVVTVVDRESGLPLAGAAVHTWDGGRSAETDVAGQLTLNVEEGLPLRLDVSAQGYASIEWGWTVAAEPAAVRLSLVRMAWISGRVTSTDGVPLADVGLFARTDEPAWESGPLELGGQGDNDLPGSAWDSDDAEVLTDEQGRYRLPVAPSASPYTVTVEHAAHAARDVGPCLVDVPGAELPLDIVLEPGATIRGRVLRHGAPLAGAGVTATDPNGDWEYARTDDQGHYDLGNVRLGEIVLTARATGGSACSHPVTLVVAAGGTYVQDFDCNEELATISGRVILDTGAALAGVNVSAGATGPDGGYRGGTSRTLEDGTWTVEVPVGLSCRVIASTGARSQWAAIEDVPAGARDIELVLPSLGTLRLLLIDALTHEPLRSAGHGMWSLAWRRAGDEAFQSINGDVDVDGVLELSLPLGVVDVSINFARLGYASAVASGLVVTAAEHSEPIVVALTKGLRAQLVVSGTPDRELLAGHVVFLLHESQLGLPRGPFPSAGGPSNFGINGVHLWVAQPALLDQLVMFDLVDSVDVEGLAPGRYHIRCFPDDVVFEPASFELTAESAPHPVSWRAR